MDVVTVVVMLGGGRGVGVEIGWLVRASHLILSKSEGSHDVFFVHLQESGRHRTVGQTGQSKGWTHRSFCNDFARISGVKLGGKDIQEIQHEYSMSMVRP